MTFMSSIIEKYSIKEKFKMFLIYGKYKHNFTNEKIKKILFNIFMYFQ